MTKLVKRIVDRGQHAGPAGRLARPENCPVLYIPDGLVYWGLTPQQQPGSYQGGEMISRELIVIRSALKSIVIIGSKLSFMIKCK